MYELKGLWMSIIISFIISMLIVFLSRLLVSRNVQVDKVQGYECGFQPFSSVLTEFDVQFYIVALLFLLFDVELMLLFPWSVIFMSIPFVSFCIFYIFMIILIIGMIYEWIRGGLEFSK